MYIYPYFLSLAFIPNNFLFKIQYLIVTLDIFFILLKIKIYIFYYTNYNIYNKYTIIKSIFILIWIFLFKNMMNLYINLAELLSNIKKNFQSDCYCFKCNCILFVFQYIIVIFCGKKFDHFVLRKWSNYMWIEIMIIWRFS